MAYVALYRKWRPGGFDELVGQEHVSRTLSNAIKTGKVGHAYLFAGPRGTGKTSTAKILAKALNCEKGPTPNPCNECEACRKINDGSSMDVYEIDAASNRGIDEIRELRETVKFAPADGHYKVYIIDEVHMLTMEAFNALLKTLEEPPAHVVFILATTEAHKVPATIQSRCQRYDFRRITAADIQGRLQLVADNMGLEYDEEALKLIAIKADGGMRDALGLLDQCGALVQGKLTAEQAGTFLGLIGREWIQGLVEAVGRADAASVLAKVAELLQGGKELAQMLSELALYFRSMLILKAAGDGQQMDYAGEDPQTLARLAAAFTQPRLMDAIRRVHSAIAELKWSPQPRITVESALLELCQGEAVAPGGGSATRAVGTEAASASDDRRLAQLEARLAQLMNMVQKGGLPGTGQANSDMPAAPGAGDSQGTATGIREELPRVQAQAPGADKIKQQILQELERMRQIPACSCMKKSGVLSMTQDRLVLGCSNTISKRMLDQIYRPKLQEILQRLMGHPMQLVVQLAEVLPAEQPEPELPEAPPPPEDDGIPDLPPPPEQDKERIDQVADVFGGELVPPPEE